jgi:hypothetical protein
MPIMRIMTIIQIMQKVLNKVPQFSCRGLGPVLKQFWGGEKIKRCAILRVHWNIRKHLKIVIRIVTDSVSLFMD